MNPLDYTKLIPYALGLAAVALAAGWFAMHNRAVANEAIAKDRAAANLVLIEAQQKSLADKQKLIDVADELSKARYEETLAATKAAAFYKAAYAKLAADPDVARVLVTRLPESLRQLRRTSAAPGAGDGIPVLHAPGVAAADGGAGLSGSDRRGSAGREPTTARGAPVLQPGQGEGARTGEATAARIGDKAADKNWWNPMKWFQPSPSFVPRSTP